MNRIIRVKSDKGFTMIPNTVFKSELSLRAIGLLTYILHLPDDWVLYKTFLYETLPKDGRDAVKTAWRELEENGFIVAERTASHGRGKLPETNYLVYDNPVKTGGLPSTETRPSNIPPSKTRLRNTRLLLNTNELNTNKQITNELNTDNTLSLPAGNADPSPTIILELEEKIKANKEKKKSDRLPLGDDSEEIKKELSRYEGEMVPELRKMDVSAAKRKIAEYIQEKKPAFYQPYKDLWNLSAPANGLAKIEEMSPGRLNKFKTRIKEQAFDFIRIMMEIKKSKFMKGDNKNNWKVDWKFIFENDTNYLNIIEGKYP